MQQCEVCLKEEKYCTCAGAEIKHAEHQAKELAFPKPEEKKSPPEDVISGQPEPELPVGKVEEPKKQMKKQKK